MNTLYFLRKNMVKKIIFEQRILKHVLEQKLIKVTFKQMLIFYFFLFTQSKKEIKPKINDDGDVVRQREPKLYEKYVVDVASPNEQKIEKIEKYEFFGIPFMVTITILTIIIICFVLLLLLLRKNKTQQNKAKYD